MDPLGLFRFGTRPLGNLPVAISLGNSNISLLHENGFYQNGYNVGYFPEGIRKDKLSQSDNYQMSGSYYLESLMRQAENALRASGRWAPDDQSEPWYSNENPNDYDLTLHNCQDSADALRRKYSNLGGKECPVPFTKEGICLGD